MAVQFSLSYDANGDPVLVENTVTGTRKVVSRSSVVSPYKSRFEAPASSDPITDAEESQPESNQSAIYDYIKEMENGAADDLNLSFVEKQGLERYTPEAIEARSKEPTSTQKFVKTVMNFLTPLGQVETFAKAISAILPDESEEIKAIKQFYADPEQQQLVESIPGMSNYNLVYGNPFDPSYGLANAAQKRINTIDKTLQKQINKGLTPSQTLIERKQKLEELIQKENDQKGEITRKTTGAVGAQFKETGYADPGADAEENQPYSPPSNNNDSGNQGSSQNYGSNITGSVSAGGTDDTAGSPF